MFAAGEEYEVLTLQDLDDLYAKTVKVYARHKADCAHRGKPEWRRCRCTKYLYIYRNQIARQVSARTRSWERAAQKAEKIRESFALATEPPGRESPAPPAAQMGVDIRQASEEFLEEVARLNREEATLKKYQLTLHRLANWCAAQPSPVFLLAELDVPTLRRWIVSWT